MYLSEGHEASACDENTFFVWLKVCSFCLAVHTQWAIVGGLCEDINAVIVMMGCGGVSVDLENSKGRPSFSLALMKGSPRIYHSTPCLVLILHGTIIESRIFFPGLPSSLQ